MHKTKVVCIILALISSIEAAGWRLAPEATVSASAAPAAVCDDLVAEESADKNYYQFRASATAAGGSTITGYKFIYGDKESYSFNFPANVRDRSSAVVRHTYLKAGTYTATVNVLTSVQGKKNSVTSKNCSVQISINQPQLGELASVGPSAILPLFGIGVVVGTLYKRRALLR